MAIKTRKIRRSKRKNGEPSKSRSSNKNVTYRFLLACVGVALFQLSQQGQSSVSLGSYFSGVSMPSSLISMPALNDWPSLRTATTPPVPMTKVSKGSQPRVILHIGPHKTATTTIQDFIKEPDVVAALSQDNVSMPTIEQIPGTNRRYPEFNWAECILEESRRRPVCRGRIKKGFAPYVKEMYHSGKDILLVAEDLDRDDVAFDLLRNSLEPYTDIQVVVVYRRLHDWFKSWYNEIMRLYISTWARVNILLPGFPEFLQKVNDNETNYDHFYQRHTMGLEDKYRRNGFPVTVLHYHRNTSMRENLFCDILSLPNTCNAIQTDQIQRSVGNARVSQKGLCELCRWVWAATDFNLYWNMRTCERVAEKWLPVLKELNISILDDFPLIRPPESMVESTWNHTMAAERRYFSQLGDMNSGEPTPEFWATLRRQFDHAIRTKWYAIDVDELRRTGKFNNLLGIGGEPTVGRYLGQKTATSVTQQQQLTNQLKIWNCLEIKDGELYIDEWLDYHYALGFTFVRIFDNSANFTMRDWAPRHYDHKNKLKVTHHPDIPGKVGTQSAAYKQCIQEAVAQNIDWVATIDVDEFLVLKKHDTIGDLLTEHCQKEEQCGQISFNWRMFGSANQTKYSSVPVLRRFQYYIDQAWQGTVKVIVDPKAVNLDRFKWQHSMVLKPGYKWLDTDGNVITNTGWKMMSNDNNPTDVAVLNHYRYKSQEEWDIVNCVRGNEYNFKANKRCHTPAEVGTVFDDTAFKKLRDMVLRYQVYDRL